MGSNRGFYEFTCIYTLFQEFNRDIINDASARLFIILVGVMSFTGVVSKGKVVFVLFKARRNM